MLEKVFHLLAEMFFYCWGLLRAELPNCALILDDLRVSRRSGLTGFLWLCYITAFASFVRVMSIAWFFVAVIVLAAHFKLGWPPYEFVQDDKHFLSWGFSLADASSLPPLHVHYCVTFGIVAMTMFVTMALSYFGVARLSRELVGIFCPASGSAGQPPKIPPKQRKKKAA